MAISPQINELIEILHNSDRSGDWEQRIVTLYDAALETLPTPEAGLKKNVLDEILRQRVDEDILDDVMQAAEAPDSTGFASRIKTASANWAALNLAARSEEEARERPRDLSPEFMALDQNLINQMQTALQEGNIIGMLSIMFTMLTQMGNEDNNPAVAPAAASLAVAATPGAATDGAAQSEPQPLPLPDVDMSEKPEGQLLYNYFMDAIVDGNSQAQYRPIPEETALRMGTDIPNAWVAGMTPEDMHDMFRAKIEQDIANGDFPYGSFPPEQAAEKAQQIADTLLGYALDHGQSDRRRSTDMNGNPSLTFFIEEENLQMAINAMFSGPNAAFNNNMTVVADAGYFAEVYEFLRDDQNQGAALNADFINEHFDKLINGYTAPNGQHIPAVLEIPAHLQDHFRQEIERAHEAAKVNGAFDSRVFGEMMEQSFGTINLEQVNYPVRNDIFDHGVAIAAKIGPVSENGDIEIMGADDSILFDLANPEEGYEVYSWVEINGVSDFRAVDTINGYDDIERLFGAEGAQFEIRMAAQRDPNTNASTSEPAAYHITSANGNSFYILSDALPESGVGEGYRADRVQDIDTQVPLPNSMDDIENMTITPPAQTPAAPPAFR